MDMIYRIGEVFVVLGFVSLMLFYTLNSMEDLEETKQYVAKQNAQDTYAANYAKVSAVDYRAVGLVTHQEVVDFIYTHVTDNSPVMLRLSPTDRRYFVSSAPAAADGGGWNINLPSKVGNADIGTYEENQWTNIKATRLPSFEELKALLGESTAMFIVDIDPIGQGDFQLIYVSKYSN